MYAAGDILLIPFPFTEHTGAKKVRPSVVICETADTYRDIVVWEKMPIQILENHVFQSW